MRLTTDFECGGGKRLQQLGEGHWRLEATGDPSGYDKYFCVQVSADANEPAQTLRLEIHPDSELGAAGAAFFHSHFPSHLWYSSDNWGHWVPLRHTWEDSVTFGESFIEARVPVAPGAALFLATNPPRRYSDVLVWVEKLRAGRAVRLEVGVLGQSAEGRDIPLLRFRHPDADAPRLFIFGGQHPSEHCGNWACEGIAEYLLSPIADAGDIRERFHVAIVPMINPDGNVHGLSGANAEGVNLFPDFPGENGDPAPRATENRLLWRWLCAEFPPDVSLHFHGFMGWKAFSQPPFDGTYVLRDADALYSDAAGRAAYQAIQERLRFETPGFTATGSPGILDNQCLEHHLAARFGTLAAFYEINSASVGAFEQFRRGPQVLGAVARALLYDVADW